MPWTERQHSPRDCRGGGYRSRGGTRRRVLPDLIIGAHAMARAERLLTRDRGFYRSSFAKLRILEP